MIDLFVLEAGKVVKCLAIKIVLIGCKNKPEKNV